MTAEVLQRAVDYWKAARWWKNEAKTSKTPDVFLGYSRGQQLLSVDMLRNPHRYTYRRELTDWQIFQAHKGDE